MAARNVRHWNCFSGAKGSAVTESDVGSCGPNRLCAPRSFAPTGEMYRESDVTQALPNCGVGTTFHGGLLVLRFAVFAWDVLSSTLPAAAQSLPFDMLPTPTCVCVRMRALSLCSCHLAMICGRGWLIFMIRHDVLLQHLCTDKQGMRTHSHACTQANTDVGVHATAHKCLYPPPTCLHPLPACHNMYEV